MYRFSARAVLTIVCHKIYYCVFLNKDYNKNFLSETVHVVWKTNLGRFCNNMFIISLMNFIAAIENSSLFAIVKYERVIYPFFFII